MTPDQYARIEFTTEHHLSGPRLALVTLWAGVCLVAGGWCIGRDWRFAVLLLVGGGGLLLSVALTLVAVGRLVFTRTEAPR